LPELKLPAVKATAVETAKATLPEREVGAEVQGAAAGLVSSG
jgi:hypothetical protein